jgi:hypothetical protein
VASNKIKCLVVMRDDEPLQVNRKVNMAALATIRRTSRLQI